MNEIRYKDLTILHHYKATLKNSYIKIQPKDEKIEIVVKTSSKSSSFVKMLVSEKESWIRQQLLKIKNKKITFLGVTFKPNTDDMRQSSSLFMIPYFLKKGAKIS